MPNAFQTKYQQIVNASPYIQSVKRPGEEIDRTSYYAYNTVIGAASQPAIVLTLNTARTLVIETQADSDFVCAGLSAAVQNSLVNGGSLVVGRDVTLQIQDLGSGKNFFSAPTIISLVTGAGGFPYLFPSPRVLKPNTQLAVTVMNRDTANAYENVFVAIHGTRIWYR